MVSYKKGENKKMEEIKNETNEKENNAIQILEKKRPKMKIQIQ